MAMLKWITISVLRRKGSGSRWNTFEELVNPAWRCLAGKFEEDIPQLNISTQRATVLFSVQQRRHGEQYPWKEFVPRSLESPGMAGFSERQLLDLDPAGRYSLLLANLLRNFRALGVVEADVARVARALETHAHGHQDVTCCRRWTGTERGGPRRRVRLDIAWSAGGSRSATVRISDPTIGELRTVDLDPPGNYSLLNEPLGIKRLLMHVKMKNEILSIPLPSIDPGTIPSICEVELASGSQRYFEMDFEKAIEL